MSIFGPTDTRNYKKLAKELYDIEIRFANTFCEMYAFTKNSSKFAVMDAARPYGAMIYLYGAMLAESVLKTEGATGEKSILIYYLAKVHKKPESAFYGTWDDGPSAFRKSSLEEIGRAIFGPIYSGESGTRMFEQYFDQVESVVNKWNRDEF